MDVKYNSIKVFLTSLLITGLLLSIVGACYFIFTFNLAGGETLQEVESQRVLLVFLAIFILGIAVRVCIRYLKAGEKYRAIGTGILPLTLFILVGAYYIDSYNYHQQFEQKVWKQRVVKPFDMAVTLVKGNKIIGMTKAEVKQMLGKDYEEFTSTTSMKSYMYYLVEQKWRLGVVFENDVVVDVKLQLPRMMS